MTLGYVVDSPRCPGMIAEAHSHAGRSASHRFCPATRFAPRVRRLNPLTLGLLWQSLNPRPVHPRPATHC